MPRLGPPKGQRLDATDLDTLYSGSFYESLRETSARSAATVVPVLIEIVHPRSVVDVGCGDGAWLAAFADQGVKDLTGIDGPWAQSQWETRSDVTFLTRDLASPFEVGRRYDLALCLEVAEHLPPEAARGLIAELARLSSVVVFSAAVPHQGGDGHLNEDWPSRWSPYFAAEGLEFAANLRWRFWSDNRVAFWYRQNLLCYVAKGEQTLLRRLRELEREWTTEPKDVVHPALFLRYCSDLEHQIKEREHAAREAVRLAQELTRRDQDIDHARADLSRLSADLDRAQTALLTVGADLDARQTELAGARGELAGTRAELTNARAELAGAQSELTNVRGELAGVQAELTNVRAELAGAQAELTNARTELACVRDELNDVQADLTDVQAELASTKTELSSARAQGEQFDTELQEIKGSRAWRLVQLVWRLSAFLRWPARR